MQLYLSDHNGDADEESKKHIAELVAQGIPKVSLGTPETNTLYFQTVEEISEKTSSVFKLEHYLPEFLKAKLPGQYLLNDACVFFKYEYSSNFMIRQPMFVKQADTLKGFPPTTLFPGEYVKNLALTEDVLIMFTSAKDLTDAVEYRCFVANGSLLHIVDTYIPERRVPADVVSFSEEVIPFLSEVPVFVLDVIKTNGVVKVVEINPIETSGFFADYEYTLGKLSTAALLVR